MVQDLLPQDHRRRHLRRQNSCTSPNKHVVAQVTRDIMFRQPFMSAERIREELTAQGFLSPPPAATALADNEGTASSADVPSASAAMAANSDLPMSSASPSTASGSPTGQSPSSVQPLVMVRYACAHQGELALSLPP